jgi:hypothetical protein
MAPTNMVHQIYESCLALCVWRSKSVPTHTIHHSSVITIMLYKRTRYSWLPSLSIKDSEFLKRTLLHEVENSGNRISCTFAHLPSSSEYPYVVYYRYRSGGASRDQIFTMSLINKRLQSCKLLVCDKHTYFLNSLGLNSLIYFKIRIK